MRRNVVVTLSYSMDLHRFLYLLEEREWDHIIPYEVPAGNGMCFTRALSTLRSVVGVQTYTELWGFVGSDRYDLFVREVEALGAVSRIEARPGKTRVNESDWHSPTERITTQGRNSYTLTRSDMQSIIDMVSSLGPIDNLFITGSGPNWSPRPQNQAAADFITGSFYADLIYRAQRRGVWVALDTRPGPLKVAFDLGARPDLVKVNGFEQQALAGGRIIEADDEWAAMAKDLLPNGRFVASGNGGIRVREPSGKVRRSCFRPSRPYTRFNLDGSGDTVMAASSFRGVLPTKMMAKLATAGRAAQRTTLPPGYAPERLIREFMPDVELRRTA